MVVLAALALAVLQPVSGGPIIGHAAGEDAYSAIASPAARLVARRCGPTLERRAGGTLSAIEVSRTSRSGTRTTISGTMRALLRPKPAAAGEMTPMHIVAARFAFRCTVSGTHVRRATVSRLKG